MSYWSKITVDAVVFTKNPRIKYTPSFTEKEDPVEVEFEIIHLANWLSAAILVFKKVIPDKVIKFSPSWNVLVVPSVPDFEYFTYNVSNPSIDSGAVNLFTTVASTPDISPFIFILLSAKNFV